MTLGEKIREARLRKGFTLKELGAIVGVSHSALSQIENNKNDVSKKNLIALAKALGDNFGEAWLDEHLKNGEGQPSKKEIVQNMSIKEFVSLKFEGKRLRRSKAEIEMLTRLLEANLERDDDEE
jgi:transcriptional regulator with XRE-family HTH domain